MFLFVFKQFAVNSLPKDHVAVGRVCCARALSLFVCSWLNRELIIPSIPLLQTLLSKSQLFYRFEDHERERNDLSVERSEDLVNYSKNHFSFLFFCFFVRDESKIRLELFFFFSFLFMCLDNSALYSAYIMAHDYKRLLYQRYNHMVWFGLV